jgi:hypothetical protein
VFAPASRSGGRGWPVTRLLLPAGLAALQGAAGFLGKQLEGLANHKAADQQQKQGLAGAAEGALNNPNVSEQACARPAGCMAWP